MGGIWRRGVTGTCWKGMSWNCHREERRGSFGIMAVVYWCPVEVFLSSTAARVEFTVGLEASIAVNIMMLL